MSSKKSRSAKTAPNLETSGLLDAYTDSTSNPGVGVLDKPISKKNKNRRKREQQQKEERERRESENQSEAAAATADDEGEVILDSWEDNEDDGDAPPPPPEFVIDQSAVEERKKKKEEEELKAKKAVDQAPKPKKPQPKKGQDSKVKAALGNINKTITSVSELLKSVSIKEEPVKSQKKDTEVKDAEKEKAKGQEKSKEEIKAEREAKKKAKQEARAAKSEGKPKTEFVKPDEGPKKSNAELKAERRAKQEAQRAAKAAAVAVTDKSQKPKEKEVKVVEKKQRVPDDIQADRVSVERKLQKHLASQNLPQRPKAQKKVMLFSHLHQYERELSISRDLPIVGSHIHPAVVQLGLQYSQGTIQGSNARCLSFMKAMKVVVSDYKAPEDRQFSRDLDAHLKTYITFLKGCRNHSVSMGNAIRYLKTKVNSIKVTTPEDEAKRFLIDSIDSFVNLVELAAKQISITACEKIRDGDVILTYGCSSLLKAVFEEAAEQGRKFKVIVADGRPRFEGREMARALINSGIHCTYVMVHSLSFLINEVSKVFLGAHAVFANGYMMSRVGTAQVAMIAKAQNVPVLVCCETYKFSDRVQTDSFVFNELGDPDDLVATGTNVASLEDWRDLSSLNLLNLSYDVTPATLIDAIISEISVIPCTSVPVVLRLKSMDLN